MTNCNNKDIANHFRLSFSKGRQFYKCPKRDGDGKCSFFLWADQASDGVSNPARVNPGPSSSFSNYSSYDSQGNRGPKHYLLKHCYECCIWKLFA